MTSRITDKARRDFEFLRDTALDTIGEGTEDVMFSEGGHSAMECWFARDTHGESLPCREPDVLAKVIRSKESWNLQIKQWAEDVNDGLLLQQSELVDYCHGLPAWIFTAVLNQAAKLSKAIRGWVPRFARAEYIHGTLWFPWMDHFDPQI